MGYNKGRVSKVVTHNAHQLAWEADVIHVVLTATRSASLATHTNLLTIITEPLAIDAISCNVQWVRLHST